MVKFSRSEIFGESINNKMFGAQIKRHALVHLCDDNDTWVINN